MKALIIGCGRVGSSIALQLDREGWDVVAVDEKEEALTRLGSHWNGGFIVGHGMDVDVLRQAGIEAVLQVYEGQSHAQYYRDDTAPESKEAFEEIAGFFDKHLGK